MNVKEKHTEYLKRTKPIKHKLTSKWLNRQSESFRCTTRGVKGLIGLCRVGLEDILNPTHIFELFRLAMQIT